MFTLIGGACVPSVISFGTPRLASINIFVLLAQIIIALYNIYRGVNSKSSTLFPLISDFMVYTKVTEAQNHSLTLYMLLIFDKVCQ
jgi:hypothetical protein